MSESALKGGCFCGAVRFEVTPPTKWCAHCHCASCRAAAGAAFVTFVGVKDSQFRLLCDEQAVQRFQTSLGVFRSYCSMCGSHLFYQGERWPNETHIVRAAFDGEIDHEPQVNVYWDEHVNWTPIDETIPKLGGVTGEEPL